MSLEDKIDALTVALEKNNELLTFMTSAARKGLEAGAAKAPVTAAPTADAEPAKTTRAPRGAAKDKAPKIPTVKEISDQTKAFLDVKDEDEYTERRAFVTKIVEAFAVKKMSEIGDGDRQKALDYLTAYIAGEQTDLDDEGGEEDLA